MKLSLVFLFLFIFPYLKLKILFLTIFLLFRNKNKKNCLLVFTRSTNSNIKYFFIFILLNLFTNNNYQNRIQILKKKLLMISCVNFKLNIYNNQTFCKIYVYYLTYNVIMYIIRIFCINITHMIFIKNLYMFVKCESLMSRIVNLVNIFCFYRKYHFNLYILSVLKNIGILEINIKSVKDFHIAMKCKYNVSSSISIDYIKYYLNNFLNQFISNRIRLSSVVWNKLIKNKI